VQQRTSPPGVPVRTVVALALLVVLAVLAALYATNLRISGRPSLTTADINAIVNQKVSTAISQLESQPPAAATAYQAVRAGLVVIAAEHQGKPGTEDLGTGVMVDTLGDILTALHVVQGASEIRVTFAEGTVSAARVVGSDPTHDIAVLATERLPAVIIPAVLGPTPQIGDEVFAVGNPLGLVGSLSAGVVSGLDRTFKLGDGRTFSGMIQFDAAVNPGSSGGPLLNTKGQVIGIVTGLANPAGTDNFAGIGFAVPIATAGRAAGAPAK
jgi:S1-C subfamily serine protease